MSSPFELFRGDGRQNPELGVQLPPPLYAKLRQPDRYLVDDGLRDACNVALLLGQPLLLTGEPGTGKSRFAHALAWEFGLGDPLVFEVKSTSTARNLFYQYDALQRYQDIQSGILAKGAPPTNYLTIQALGPAIINSHAPADLPAAIAGLAHSGAPRRSVVLLDEVDKAPRDFPNDVLNELEDLRLQAQPELRPLMVLTSNSERDLPDAFLRRCVYYHLPFPDREKLEEIVALQLQEFPPSTPLNRDAITLFLELRKPSSGLRKKPATAELLLWLLTLRRLLGESGEANGLRGNGQKEAVRRSLSSLIKTADDRTRAEELVNQWLSG